MMNSRVLRLYFASDRPSVTSWRQVGRNGRAHVYTPAIQVQDVLLHGQVRSYIATCLGDVICRSFSAGRGEQIVRNAVIWHKIRGFLIGKAKASAETLTLLKLCIV